MCEQRRPDFGGRSKPCHLYAKTNCSRPEPPHWFSRPGCRDARVAWEECDGRPSLEAFCSSRPWTHGSQSTDWPFPFSPRRHRFLTRLWTNTLPSVGLTLMCCAENTDESLANGKLRLHLTSWQRLHGFQLGTSRTDAVMSDLQKRILQVVRQRAERGCKLGPPRLRNNNTSSPSLNAYPFRPADVFLIYKYSGSAHCPFSSRRCGRGGEFCVELGEKIVEIGSRAGKLGRFQYDGAGSRNER